MEPETIDTILQWAQAHHWACLRLPGKQHGTSDFINYGEGKWKHALATSSPERIARIQAGIERWNNLEQGIAS